MVVLASALPACLDSDPPFGVLGYVEDDFGGIVLKWAIDDGNGGVPVAWLGEETKFLGNRFADEAQVVHYEFPSPQPG